jgi:hypothetical protein
MIGFGLSCLLSNNYVEFNDGFDQRNDGETNETKTSKYIRDTKMYL